MTATVGIGEDDVQMVGSNEEGMNLNAGFRGGVGEAIANDLVEFFVWA